MTGRNVPTPLSLGPESKTPKEAEPQGQQMDPPSVHGDPDQRHWELNALKRKRKHPLTQSQGAPPDEPSPWVDKPKAEWKLHPLPPLPSLPRMN